MASGSTMTSLLGDVKPSGALCSDSFIWERIDLVTVGEVLKIRLNYGGTMEDFVKAWSESEAKIGQSITEEQQYQHRRRTLVWGALLMRQLLPPTMADKGFTRAGYAFLTSLERNWLERQNEVLEIHVGHAWQRYITLARPVEPHCVALLGVDHIIKRCSFTTRSAEDQYQDQLAIATLLEYAFEGTDLETFTTSQVGLVHYIQAFKTEIHATKIWYLCISIEYHLKALASYEHGDYQPRYMYLGHLAHSQAELFRLTNDGNMCDNAIVNFETVMSQLLRGPKPWASCANTLAKLYASRFVATLNVNDANKGIEWFLNALEYEKDFEAAETGLANLQQALADHFGNTNTQQ